MPRTLKKSKKTVKPSARKAPRLQAKSSVRKTRPSKGIIMTIVAMGLFAAFFVLLQNSSHNQQGSLLGANTFLARGGDDSSGSGSGSGSDSSGSGTNSGSSSGSASGESSVTAAPTVKPTEHPAETETETHTEPTKTPGTAPSPTRPPEPTRFPSAARIITGTPRVEPTHREPTHAEPSRGPRTIRPEQLSNGVKMTESEHESTPGSELKKPQDRITPSKAPGITLRSDAKLKFENKNGQIEVRKENADGSETLLNGSSKDDALNDLEGSVKIISTDKSLAISSGSVAAKTDLRLSINPDTNKVGIDSLGETKDLSVMPEDAVSALKTSNVIDDVKPDTTGALSQSANPEVKDVITLKSDNGQPVFEIQGTKKKKLFGLIPVTINKTVSVSAESGKVVSEDISTFDKILNIISL